MRFTAILFGFVFLSLSAFSQGVWVAWNLASLPTRTIDLQAFVHPKNEDWLTLQGGFGYSLKGSTLFSKKSDCLDDQKSGGYHFRLGGRASMTADHHESHVFGGVNLLFSKYNESANYTACDPDQPQAPLSGKGFAVGGVLQAGYSLNLTKKYLKPKLFVDLGGQVGVPLHRSQPFLGTRNYISGLGIGKSGDKGINLELIIAVRFEVWHGKYGYRKLGKIKR